MKNAIFPVVWSAGTKEASAAFSLFALLTLSLAVSWLVLARYMDAATVQAHLDGLITLEVTLLAVLIAGLGITTTLVANQASRLDQLKPELVKELQRESWAPLLMQKAERYKSDYLDKTRSPASPLSSYRSPRVKGVSAPDVFQNYKALAEVAKGSPDGSEIETSGAQLFKAAASALLCRTWLDSDDPLHPLAAAVQRLDETHGIVELVNRTYDMRTAARRGLPIFSLFLCLSLITSVIASGLPTSHLAQQWFVRSAIFPIFPIAYFIGVYAYRIPVQYMSQ
jgi:hypothetical protein